MITNDQRTEEQKKTHRWAIVARDKFMSGWGGASGGVSRCAWAVTDDFAASHSFTKLRQWVESRPEMKYVNVADLSTYRPKNTAHFSIYTADHSHPSQ